MGPKRYSAIPGYVMHSVHPLQIVEQVFSELMLPVLKQLFTHLC